MEKIIKFAAGPLDRIWLVILYATGMRREELVRLKVDDIDRGRMVIHLRRGKGRKDRDVMISTRLLEELRDYWRRVQPKSRTWLFHSKAPHQKRGVPMQAKRVFNAVQQAAKRAGIDKYVVHRGAGLCDSSVAGKRGHKELEKLLRGHLVAFNLEPLFAVAFVIHVVGRIRED